MAGRKRIIKLTMPTISKMQTIWNLLCHGKSPHKAAAIRTRQIRRVSNSRGGSREIIRLQSIDIITSLSQESNHRLTLANLKKRVNLLTPELIVSMVIRKVTLRRKRSKTILHHRVQVNHREAVTVHHRYLQILHNLENIIGVVHLRSIPLRKSIK